MTFILKKICICFFRQSCGRIELSIIIGPCVLFFVLQQSIIVMINKYTSDQQSCVKCETVLMDQIGTQVYCPQCHHFASNLQQQLRVVPEQYESNCKNRRELQKERRFNALIREFSDKHRELRSKEELQVFREKLRAIKRLTVNRKGSRQAAGVVVFCEMQQQIKMTIKQFCKSNNLSVKLFNQKYKIYKDLQKQGSKLSEPFKLESMLFLKQEEEDNKIEESPTERESDHYFYSSQLENKKIEEEEEFGSLVERARHALLLIYDHVFTRYIFKEKKTMLIQGLVRKFEEITKQTLADIRYDQSPPLKIYYLIFAVIKSSGYTISFMEYAQIIQKQTGYLLKRKPATEIKRIYQRQMAQNQQICSVKVEERDQEEGEKTEKVVVPKKASGRRKVKKEVERVDVSDSDLNMGQFY